MGNFIVRHREIDKGGVLNKTSSLLGLRNGDIKTFISLWTLV